MLDEFYLPSPDIEDLQGVILDLLDSVVGVCDNSVSVDDLAYRVREWTVGPVDRRHDEVLISALGKSGLGMWKEASSSPRKNSSCLYEGTERVESLRGCESWTSGTHSLDEVLLVSNAKAPNESCFTLYSTDGRTERDP